jgi:hypothetical protein
MEIGQVAISVSDACQMNVKLPNHELWIGILRATGGKLVGLMEEKPQ